MNTTKFSHFCNKYGWTVVPSASDCFIAKCGEAKYKYKTSVKMSNSADGKNIPSTKQYPIFVEQKIAFADNGNELNKMKFQFNKSLKLDGTKFEKVINYGDYDFLVTIEINKN